MKLLVLSIATIISILIAIGFLSLYVLIFVWMIDAYDNSNKESKNE